MYVNLFATTFGSSIVFSPSSPAFYVAEEAQLSLSDVFNV